MLTPERQAHSGFVAVGITSHNFEDRDANSQTTRIQDLWQRYFQDTIATTISNKKPGSPPTVCYFHYKYQAAIGAKPEQAPPPHDNFWWSSLLIGHEVKNPDGVVPEELERLVVPGGDFLVFAIRGNPPTSVRSMWPKIEEHFQQPTAPQRARTVDFEIYRADGVDIYISVV